MLEVYAETQYCPAMSSDQVKSHERQRKTPSAAKPHDHTQTSDAGPRQEDEWWPLRMASTSGGEGDDRPTNRARLEWSAWTRGAESAVTKRRPGRYRAAPETSRGHVVSGSTATSYHRRSRCVVTTSRGPRRLVVRMESALCWMIHPCRNPRNVC